MMISNQQRQQILTLHQTGCKIRHISRLVRVSRNTVRRVIKSERGQHKVRKCRHQAVEPLVRQHFGECRQNAVRVGEILSQRYGQTVAYSSLTRMVRQMDLRENKRRRSGSYEFGPGEEMQHDTSPHTLQMGDRKVKAQCASLVLGYSKKLFIQYYPKFTRFEAKVFLTTALKYMGGSCGRCIIDNTSVIVAHGSGSDAVMAPEMEAFAQMFGANFVAHNIDHADRKAKVERNFSYAENNFLAGRVFTGWDDLNRRAVKWCDDRANVKPKRSLGGMSPAEVSLMEKPHLNPLPIHIPPVYMTLVRMVDLSGFVTVDTNRYSVPENLCGRKVEVLKGYEFIEVYYKNRKVAEHRRLLDKRDGKITAAGHHMPIERKKSKGPCKEQQALTGRHDWLDQYVVGLKKRAYGSGRRKLGKMLELERTYPAEAFKNAVQKALQYGLYDLSRLERMILSFVAGDFFNLKQDD
jgi:transposase